MPKIPYKSSRGKSAMASEDIDKEEVKKIEVLITTVLVAACFINKRPYDDKDAHNIVSQCSDAAKHILKLIDA